jgi:hypothetical protein
MFLPSSMNDSRPVSAARRLPRFYLFAAVVLYCWALSPSARAQVDDLERINSDAKAVVIGQLTSPAAKDKMPPIAAFKVLHTYKGEVPREFEVSMQGMTRGAWLTEPKAVGLAFVIFMKRGEGGGWEVASHSGSILPLTDDLRKRLDDLYAGEPPQGGTPGGGTGGVTGGGTGGVGSGTEVVEQPSWGLSSVAKRPGAEEPLSDVIVAGVMEDLRPGREGTGEFEARVKVKYSLLGGIQPGNSLTFRIPAPSDDPALAGRRPVRPSPPRDPPGQNELWLLYLNYSARDNVLATRSAYEGCERLLDGEAAAERIESILARQEVWRYWETHGGFQQPLRITRSVTAAIWQTAWNSPDANMGRIMSCYSRSSVHRTDYLSGDEQKRNELRKAYDRFHESDATAALQLVRELPHDPEAEEVKVEARLIFRHQSGQRETVGRTPLAAFSGKGRPAPPPGADEDSPVKIIMTFKKEGEEWLILDEGF